MESRCSPLKKVKNCSEYLSMQIVFCSLKKYCVRLIMMKIKNSNLMNDDALFGLLTRSPFTVLCARLELLNAAYYELGLRKVYFGDWFVGCFFGLFLTVSVYWNIRKQYCANKITHEPHLVIHMCFPLYNFK